jgi:hypothetical protein
MICVADAVGDGLAIGGDEGESQSLSWADDCLDGEGNLRTRAGLEDPGVRLTGRSDIALAAWLRGKANVRSGAEAICQS